MDRPSRPTGSDKQCRHCKHFDSVVNLQAPGGSQTICRQRAPSAVAAIAGMMQGKAADGSPLQIPVWSQCTIWPIVGATDWCADFARKLESVN